MKIDSSTALDETARRSAPRMPATGPAIERASQPVTATAAMPHRAMNPITATGSARDRNAAGARSR